MDGISLASPVLLFTAALVACGTFLLYKCRFRCRLRKNGRDITLGFGPLYFFVGVSQVLQFFFAIQTPIHKLDDSNLGSTVFYPTCLMLVLLLYTLQDVLEWKRLCASIFATNIFAVAPALILTHFLLNFDGQDVGNNQNLAYSWAAIISVIGGTVIWLMVMSIMVVLHDWLRRLPTFPRFAICLCVPLAIDSLAYGFLLQKLFGRTLTAGPSALKFAVGFIDAILLAFYLWKFEREDLVSLKTASDYRAFLKYLIYIKRYREIRPKLEIDEESGLYNNRLFMKELRHSILLSEITLKPICVVECSLERFDEFGEKEKLRVFEAFLEIIDESRKSIEENDFNTMSDRRHLTVYRCSSKKYRLLLMDADELAGMIVEKRIEKKLLRLGVPSDDLTLKYHVYHIPTFDDEIERRQTAGELLDGLRRILSKSDPEWVNADSKYSLDISHNAAEVEPIDDVGNNRAPVERGTGDLELVGDEETLDRNLEAAEQFRNDLPGLIRDALSGKWVAYYGKRRLGVESTQARLVNRLLLNEKKYPIGHCYIRRVADDAFEADSMPTGSVQDNPRLFQEEKSQVS